MQTFHPLKLTKLAKELDEPDYPYSWYEEPGESHTFDQDPAGATSHL